MLINSGADVNKPNEHTMYPLHSACTVGSLEIAQVIIIIFGTNTFDSCHK